MKLIRWHSRPMGTTAVGCRGSHTCIIGRCDGLLRLKSQTIHASPKP